MKRKEFLSSVAAAAALTVTPSLASAAVPHPAMALLWPPIDPQDEQFWKFVRGQFPLTQDRAYFNTGGLGASPYVVIDAVKAKIDELEKVSETGHSEDLLKEMRTDIAALLGGDPSEVAFIRNTTEGINIVANGLPFKPGDEVILTTHEHVGNSLIWMLLQKRAGIALKMFEPSTTSIEENLDRIQKLITRKTRLISVPHVLTTTGLILPVREIAEVARQKKLWFFVDGAQTAGMFPFSLHEIGCDAYATSGHKWLLGPKETGLLYVRREMQDVIQTKFVGAYSAAEFDFPKGTFTLLPSAQRYEYGTVSIPLRCGLHAGVKFLGRVGMENVWARDRQLSNRLFEGLQATPSVEILSPADNRMRSAMITFRHRTLPYLKLQEHLDTYKLRTRGVNEANLGALRVSTHIYNSPEEVDRVLEGVKTAK